MINLLFDIKNDAICIVLSIIISMFLSTLFIRIGIQFLPKDQGRNYAYDGKKSIGKPRGAGIIFTISSLVLFLVLVPFKLEYLFYYLMLLLAMLTGFFDDISKISWGELKKGLLDLVICILTVSIFVFYNNNLGIILFGSRIPLSIWIYFPLAVILLLTSINVTNCTDGVDGLLGTVSIVSIITYAIIINILDLGPDLIQMNVIFIASLIGYLVFNAPPSQLIMGDAGSRTIGLFIGIMALKTQNPILFIPISLIIILDGGIGLLKLAVIRITKKRDFLNRVRTPLHDHVRQKWGWSNTQVNYRFAIFQIFISLICILFIL